MWKVIHSGKKTAEENMRLDEKLLDDLDPFGSPVLHLYEFSKPAATYGYFINADNFLHAGHGLDLGKRPTGGGILLHLWDVTFSVCIPRSHRGYSDDVMRNYQYINDLVRLAILECLGTLEPGLLLEEKEPSHPACKNFCFAKPTKYDVMVGEKKVAGSAQRRKKNGFLHQGSISFGAPDRGFLEKILPEPVILAMEKHTFIFPHGERKALLLALQKVLTRV